MMFPFFVKINCLFSLANVAKELGDRYPLFKEVKESYILKTCSHHFMFKYIHMKECRNWKIIYFNIFIQVSVKLFSES